MKTPKNRTYTVSTILGRENSFILRPFAVHLWWNSTSRPGEPNSRHLASFFHPRKHPWKRQRRSNMQRLWCSCGHNDSACSWHTSVHHWSPYPAQYFRKFPENSANHVPTLALSKEASYQISRWYIDVNGNLYNDFKYKLHRRLHIKSQDDI